MASDSLVPMFSKRFFPFFTNIFGLFTVNFNWQCYKTIIIGSCFYHAYIELWMYLGSLESTQEAGVPLGYALSNSYGSLVSSKFPAFVHP